MSSSLLQKILDDIKVAMKSREALILEVLRTLHSDIKNVSINSGKEITDEIVVDVLAKSVKQKNEAIEMLKAGGREEKVAVEEFAINVYKRYLPQELSEDEVIALIAQIKESTGAAGPKDMGKLKKAITPQVKGRFDAKRVSVLVQDALK